MSMRANSTADLSDRDIGAVFRAETSAKIAPINGLNANTTRTVAAETATNAATSRTKNVN